MSSISIRFPFQTTTEGGLFKSNKTTSEKVRTNLLSLLTTKRGHRVMRPDFFSPFFDYIYEPMDSFTMDRIRDETIDKIKEFIPEVEVVNFKVSTDEEENRNLIKIKINYKIISLGNFNDSINIVVPVENI